MKHRPTYNVTVEGKGSVCYTVDLKEATRMFEIYRNRSIKGIGFAAGKNVITYLDGAMIHSYMVEEDAE